MQIKKIIPMTVLAVVVIAAAIFVIVQIKNYSKIDENALLKPNAITTDHSLDKSVVDQMIRTARIYYTFWSTGQSKYLEAAISPKFIDHTLPEGHPQGIDGIKYASQNYRLVIPDLQCAVEDMLITGDKVTARLACGGTFLGTFQGQRPTGKPVKFNAIDILQIQKGLITEMWHVEDHLSLMKQLNVVKSPEQT